MMQFRDAVIHCINCSLHQFSLKQWMQPPNGAMFQWRNHSLTQ
jgi:hypothetical protein